MECAVCFSDVVGGVRCCRMTCTVRICNECINGLIKHCFDNYRVVPACVGDKCSGVYLWSNINGVLSRDAVDMYCKICVKYTTQAIEDKNRRRDERREQKRLGQEFIEKARQKFKMEFTPAMVRLIEISGLETRLKKIERENEKKKQRTTTVQQCVSFSCRGTVDDSGVCNKCGIKMCLDCKLVYGAHHKCNQDDIASAAAIDKATKCPSCKAPVTRDVGCNFVTCPYCSVNFDVTTGQVSFHGGHNDNGPLVKRSRYSLATEFDDDDMKALISEIEQSRPSGPTTTHPAKRYEMLIKNKMYSDCIAMIYEYRQQGKLSKSVLVEICEHVKSLQ